MFKQEPATHGPFRATKAKDLHRVGGPSSGWKASPSVTSGNACFSLVTIKCEPRRWPRPGGTPNLARRRDESLRGQLSLLLGRHQCHHHDTSVTAELHQYRHNKEQAEQTGLGLTELWKLNAPTALLPREDFAARGLNGRRAGAAPREGYECHRQPPSSHHTVTRGCAGRTGARAPRWGRSHNPAPSPE